MKGKTTTGALAAYSDAVFADIVTITAMELKASDQPAISALGYSGLHPYRLRACSPSNRFRTDDACTESTDTGILSGKIVVVKMQRAGRFEIV